GRTEAQSGLVGDTHGVDIALLVLRHESRIRRAWIVQRHLLCHFAGQTLPPRIRIHVKARLGVRREAIAEIRAAAFDMTLAVLAIAVLALRRGGEEVVPRPARAPGADLPFQITEAPAIDPRLERRGIAPGRRHEIDGAAERIGAVTQRVGALEHLDI